MKKIILSILLSVFLFPQAQAAESCDQNFYGQLRAGGIYTFWDDLTNVSGNPLFVNLVTTTFVPQYDYGTNPVFTESPLVANSHVWSPGETGRVVSSSAYTIGAHPPVRSQENLVIVYDVTHSEKINGTWGGGSVHRECKYYEITWCGDGVLDVSQGEQCDLGTQNGQPGSTCSATCTPVPVIPTPYYACVAGNPSADCSTNSYATQAACLIANPGASGRVCYASTNIASCNANRAVQCPIPPPNTYYSCVPGNPGADCSTNGYPTQAACLLANPGTSGRVCYTSANIASCNATRTTQCPVPPPGGGGGGPTCTTGNPAVFNGSAISFPITAATVGLCPATERVGNFIVQMNGNTSRYSWSCNSLAGINCTAFYTPGGGGGGVPPGGGTVTVPGSESTCWNGIVERPNAAGIYEQCDTNALWCDSECKIRSTTPGSTNPGRLMIKTTNTTPGRSALKIEEYKLIIGDGVPVFNPDDQIVFESTAPMYLENKIASITNNTSGVIEGTTIEKNINGWVGGLVRTEESHTVDIFWRLDTITYRERYYPTTLPLFEGSQLQRFVGDTSSFDANPNVVYQNTPASAVNGFYASLQYMQSPFDIRVSKPMISNTAGGSAFVGTDLGYSVNTVVNEFLENLQKGNFTTSTINKTGANGLSSTTSTVSDNYNLESIISSGSTLESKSIQGSSTASPVSWIVKDIRSASDLLSLDPLGDNADIRILNNGDLRILNNIALSGVKTIIIENGNLIIEENMTYASTKDSFAFIVKNGDIIIRKNVTNLVGVYVTLGSGGRITGDGPTANRLTIDGSLYGDTSQLVVDRTYVRGQDDYSALNVGVVVNYSNRAIISPPPFLSRFLNQYSLERVAK